MAESSPTLSKGLRWGLRAALVAAWFLGVGSSAFSCVILGVYRGPTPQRPSQIKLQNQRSSASIEGSVSTIVTSASVKPSVSQGVVASTSAPVIPSASAGNLGKSDVRKVAISDGPSVSLSRAEHRTEVFLETLERFRKTRLPLAVASLLLSLALVIGVWRTFNRRPGGMYWLRQVCFVYLTFLTIEHYMLRSEHAFFVGRMLQHESMLPVSTTTQDRLRLERAVQQISYGTMLFIQYALLGGLFWALGRPSVQQELAAIEPSNRSVPPPSRQDDDDET